MIHIRRYQAEDKKTWDDFVRGSKNGTFLFFRNYMEYHSDRFTDASLLFLRKDELIALMPACVIDSTFVSHSGLTYGGVVTDHRMRVPIMLDLFESLLPYLLTNGYTGLIYKAIPFIYHKMPAQEDLYALFNHKAQLFRRDVSSTIELTAKVPFNELRRRRMKKASTSGLLIKRSYDFDTFMRMVQSLLKEEHGTTPTHTAKEIECLAKAFPDNIKLFAVFREPEMLAGIIIYETPSVAHAQYIAATNAGRDAGALDLLFSYLLNDQYPHKKYFDFGTSMDPEQHTLNNGLVTYKESYGARTVLYDSYELGL